MLNFHTINWSFFLFVLPFVEAQSLTSFLLKREAIWYLTLLFRDNLSTNDPLLAYPRFLTEKVNIRVICMKLILPFAYKESYHGSL